MRWFIRIVKWLVGTTVILLVVSFFVSQMIVGRAKTFIVSTRDVGHVAFAIVPGASVLKSGKPSDILADRLTVAEQLYQGGKVDKILISGTPKSENYDEVGTMKQYLIRDGIPASAIVGDDQGIDTFATMKNAHDQFHVDDAVIVTQDFHLPRAVYLAREVGIKAVGVSATLQPYVKDAIFAAREWFANVKAVFQTATD